MNSDYATKSIQSFEYWPNYQVDERMTRSKSRPVTALSLIQEKQQPISNNYPLAYHHPVGEQRHYPSVTMSVPNPQRKIQIHNIINDDLFYSTSPYDHSTYSETTSLNDDHSLFEHSNFFDFSDENDTQAVKSTSSPANAVRTAAYDSNNSNSLFQKNSLELNDMMNHLELKDMITKMELRSHSRLNLDGLDTSASHQQLHYQSSLNAYMSEPSALSLLTNSDRIQVKNNGGVGGNLQDFSSDKSKIVGTIGRPYSTPVSTLYPSSGGSHGGSLNLFPISSKPLLFGVGNSNSSHDLSSTFGGHLEGLSSIGLEKSESPPLKTRQTSVVDPQYDQRTLSWTELEFLDDDHHSPVTQVYNSTANLLGGTANDNHNNDYSLLHGGLNSTISNGINSGMNNGMSNGAGSRVNSSDVPPSELGPYFQSFGGSASAPPLSYYKTDTSQQGRNISIDSVVSSQSSQSDKPIITGGSPSIQVGSMEEVVLRTCQEILSGASEHSLKAVELANTLRARVGIDVLSRIRERWGGLLSLLEKEHNLFRVDRIPKNDKVTLLNFSKGFSLSHLSSLSNNGSNNNISGNNSSSSSRYPQHTNNQQSLSQKSKENHRKLSDPLDPQAIGATRCLHVGNVPTNLTELQLMREFEKFGELDGLKLILQRNGSRRFAFVTFRTVDQAVTARHCLSKVHPWKNAISFARREFGPSCPAYPQKGGGGVSSDKGSHSGSSAMEYSFYSDDPHLDNRMQLQQQQQQQQQSVFNYSTIPSFNNNNSNSNNNQLATTHTLNVFNGNHNSSSTVGQQRQQQQQVFNTSSDIGVVSIRGDINCPILRRLCDDTYVPTQPWPIDIHNDEPYCQAVIQQLMQFGGYTTISKLRGFLRNRVLANDNIKSVPLKAMLSAYPQYFVLEGNLVSLKDF